MDIDKYLQMTEGSRMGKLTIFIVDKQPIFRQGLRQALSLHEDMEVVGECAPGGDTWSLVESLSPDIVLVDVGTPLVSGFDMVRQIATRCSKVAVVILASNSDDDQLFRAIKSGAVTFLSNDIAADGLAGILRRVGRREYPINDGLLLMTPLSHREIEVLKYVAEGNPNKRIAYVLNISEQTIKNHIASIMRKLNANDRTHAVALAIRNGWLSVSHISDPPVGTELTAPH